MQKTILVLGASGMLGNAVFRYLSINSEDATFGSVRSPHAAAMLPEQLRSHVISGIDVQDIDSLSRLFEKVRPDIVVNCVGVVKQLAEANDPLVAIPINSILPHRLARLSSVAGARFIHISTDCVFSGKKGMYRESDDADPYDLYGRSKLLGEVDYPNAITLRTSIIGHEQNNSNGLLNWFLTQQDSVKGYTKATFSGLPTVELARVILDFVLPMPNLHGVHHVSSAAITKFDLLELIANAYEKKIAIVPDDKVVIDRSLDSTLFRKATGYAPPSWPDLINQMRRFA